MGFLCAFGGFAPILRQLLKHVAAQVHQHKGRYSQTRQGRGKALVNRYSLINSVYDSQGEKFFTLEMVPASVFWMLSRISHESAQSGR
jgi:hypothetical protein